MTENMSAPLAMQLRLLEDWSKDVIDNLTRFVESNKDIPFIEDILSDCDAYGIAIEDATRIGLSQGNQEHQTELFRAVSLLMFTSYNMGRHHGTIEHVDLRADPQSIKALSDHLEKAREAFTLVNTIKMEVIKEKTKSLWERQSEYVGNVRGTALTIMKAANAEIQRRCGLLSGKEKVRKPEGDLGLAAMMKWVRRAQVELMASGQFARL